GGGARRGEPGARDRRLLSCARVLVRPRVRVPCRLATGLPPARPDGPVGTATTRGGPRPRVDHPSARPVPCRASHPLRPEWLGRPRTWLRTSTLAAARRPLLQALQVPA